MRPAAVLVALVAFGGCGGGANELQAPVTTRTVAPARTTTATTSRPPVPRRVSGPHDAAVPILMYHVVTAPPAGTAYPELWVPWKSFVAQMLALHKRGFHGVTLEQVRAYWDEAIALPRKPIVISFDDGYLSQYTHAARTLRALHWPGVLNLVTRNIGPGGLTEHQVSSLIEDGWELDSHTISHLDLTTLGAQQLRHELAGSRAKLRRLFGVAVDWFCYPAGRFNATVEAAVRAAGYRGATTTQPGIAAARDDRFALPRVRVDGTDSAGDVIAKLKTLGDA